MTHLDPDELALLALGEDSSADAAAHLEACPECAQQLVELGHAAGLGRQSRSLVLESPPAEVWDRIRGELALGTTAEAPIAPVTALPVGRHTPSRRRPRSRRLLPAALAALAALAVGVVGGVWLQASRSTDAVVVARADLAAFPDWQGASGSAELEDADGERQLVVHLDAEGAADSYREVWLIAADATGLVGLGVLDGADGRFTVPADIDLAEYSLVDISQEPDDGDPQHSGDSIVRGPLRESGPQAGD
ncbi:anti-sigma factor [Rathayibacter sp. VKM Ac-2835]|uniref:anti-sigma factor n=1 Tax=Rathayibacter sp. VKM Ac-2835 TaxID=2739043 RepID=UPI00156426DB|nr:anti-sigma factor [Rathayibacter sp. VKM Ac-2835]NRG41915.1 anti-sigma factor [Rathayibacter sp. VKM Ac-2835]